MFTHQALRHFATRMKFEPMLRLNVARNIHDQDIFIIHLFYNNTPSAYVARFEVIITILLQIEVSLLPCLLAPWSRFLLEEVTGFQLVKKFSSFYGTRRFITAFTSARHLSLSWASSIQSVPTHSTSWRSILILSSHLSLDLPSGFFPSGFPTKTLYTPHLSTHTRYMPRPSNSSRF